MEFRAPPLLNITDCLFIHHEQSENVSIFQQIKNKVVNILCSYVHKALINIILKGCFITFHLITFQLSIFIGFDLVFLLMWSFLSLFWLCVPKKLNKLDLYKSIKIIRLLHNNDVSRHPAYIVQSTTVAALHLMIID